MDRRHVPQTITRLVIMSALLMLASMGCRTPQSEVPPGKPYQTTGNPPTVGFSSDPHQSAQQGMSGLYANRAPGALVPDGQGSAGRTEEMVLGTPTSSGSNLGAPSDHRYSAPGTSGSSGAPSLGDSVMKTIPPASEMLKKDPDATQTSGYP